MIESVLEPEVVFPPSTPGAAIVPRFFVEQELADDSLVAPFPELLHSKQAYCLFYPEARRNDPALRAFRDWLVGVVKTKVS